MRMTAGQEHTARLRYAVDSWSLARCSPTSTLVAALRPAHAAFGIDDGAAPGGKAIVVGRL